jgi:sigma-E factor negative regulatory protein RseB
MEYSHAVNNNKEQEYLISLNSPLREIIRDKNEIIYLFKESKEVIINHRSYKHSFLVDFPQDLNALTSIYDFKFANPEIIANRPAIAVDIQPKDKLRFPRKIWLDKQNFLPLKFVAYDFSNKPLREIVATELQLKESIPFKNVTDLAGDYKKIQHDSFSQTDSYEVKNAPVGFTEVFSSTSNIHNDNRLVEHILLSDGFAKVSVYVEKINSTPDTAIIDNPQSLGTINSFTTTKNNLQITAMGEVPMMTVKLIAQSVVAKNSVH